MNEILTINVNQHVEQKNGLNYLSWAWAWTEVLKIDPLATWEVVEFNGQPCSYLKDDTAMVKTLATINGNTKSCWLPVMDHKNKAIVKPDSFAVNKAIMRCMTKAISMHGLGLYIYAGEDLPQQDWSEVDKIVFEMVEAHKEGKTTWAVNEAHTNKLLQSNEAKLYVWDQLHEYSALRSAIKANKPSPKEGKASVIASIGQALWTEQTGQVLQTIDGDDFRWTTK